MKVTSNMPTNKISTRLIQMDIKPGCPTNNMAYMLKKISAAIDDNIELIIFPEMSIPGYLLGDEWERESFLKECEACNNEICEAADGIIVVFGSIGLDWNKRNEDGRVRKYNAMFVAEDKKFIFPDNTPYPFVIKTLLPNYRIFDDSRYFYDLRKLATELDVKITDLLQPVTTSVVKLGCMLCEDAWDLDYHTSPLTILAEAGADLLINASSSPYTVNKNHKRQRLFPERCAKLKRPLIYVNNVGIQNNGKTIFTFDGASCIYDSFGNIVALDKAFEEAELSFDIPLGNIPFGKTVELHDDTIATIAKALQYGTKKFMELCGISRVTIGISGGIDSAVVAAIYSLIIEPENLLLVNMPGTYTSDTTRNLALDLAKELGCCYAEIPIETSMKLTIDQVDNLKLISPTGTVQQTLKLSDLNIENIQARDRSSRILAAVASAFGGAFTCNANKAEATIGYTTLYGDLGGYLANIADLWKTEVYQLANYLNEHIFTREVIPRGSIDIVPSAELSAAQNVDEGKGDPLVYNYHDLLFKSWVERWNRATPEDNLNWYVQNRLEKELGFNDKITNLFSSPEEFITDLERWWNLYQGMGIAKRIQAPPILAVKRRAFGFDHREAQMGPRYTRAYLKLRNTVLKQKSPTTYSSSE